MDSGWIAALASVLSALIIAITALVAFLQLRHFRYAIWDGLRPAILQRRKAFGPHTGHAFEYLAMRSRQYIDSGRIAADYDGFLRDARPS